MTATCPYCKFYQPTDRGGECRRGSPQPGATVGPLHQIATNRMIATAVWPGVGPDDWCGEWKAGPGPAQQVSQATLQ